MKIIVAGCGKIGKTIVESLVAEGHEILIIDNKPEIVEELTNIYDVMGICGNCADSDIVIDAGAGDADLYLAVTDSDELNMLSCFIAKRMGAKDTIARIRAPEYNDNSLVFMKDNLEISMPINPERLAASELFNILKFPLALKVETFSRRTMEMTEVRLQDDSVLDGVKLSDIRHKFKAQVLICCVQRGEEVFIPDGNFVLRGGDRIGVTSAHVELLKFFKNTGLLQRPVKSVIILGGSRIAYYLAQMVLDIGADVKIIDKDEKICESLGDALPKATIIHGDGSEQELLLEEGISSADAFVVLTGSDETNILVSMFAMMNGTKKVISKVNRDEIAPMAERLGLDCIISPKKMVSDVVLRYARALENSMGSNVETLYKLMDDKVEALEFNVRPDAKCVNIPLKDLKLLKNMLIIGIIRGRKVITPSGLTEILPGDRVVVITTNKGLGDLSDILQK
ncbi:MAG: Trk system potassium transporter TrkA [Clostridia bacterium]|nr:Trk system potassium transporter TrkA [Clostridia bacterium]